MNTTVYNALTKLEDDFQPALDLIYQDFKGIRNRSARPEHFDNWRERVKDKYPFDWPRLLNAVQERLEMERNSIKTA